MSGFSHPRVTCRGGAPATRYVEFREAISSWDDQKHYLLVCADDGCLDTVWAEAEAFSPTVTGGPLTAALAEEITGEYTGMVADTAADLDGRTWLLVDATGTQADALWQLAGHDMRRATWAQLADTIAQTWYAGRVEVLR